MGQTSNTNWTSMKDVRDETIDNLNNDKFKVLKKTAPKSKTWLLVENKETQKQFILLLLIEKHKGVYYVKEVDHTAGPHYYCCPTSFLTTKLVNDTATQYGLDWIADCMKYHDEKNAYKKYFASLKSGMIIRLKHTIVEYELMYQSGRGWIAKKLGGQNDGRLFKLNKNYLESTEVIG